MTTEYARFLGNFREPWEFADAETTAARLRKAGFVDIETSTEAAPTTFESAGKFSEFIGNVVFHRHLELISKATVRHEFIQRLTHQAAEDNPPYCLDYWRLNLQARVPEKNSS